MIAVPNLKENKVISAKHYPTGTMTLIVNKTAAMGEAA
jgi:hypothetical protein